jgi:ubiquinol-cytochrome c reductase cytochrome c1 subunit
MWKIVALVSLFFFLFYLNNVHRKERNRAAAPLKHVSINPHNLASLQRGAKYFMNFCSSCHSLQFLSYNRLALDLKIIDKSNPTSRQQFKNNLIFTQNNLSDAIKTSLHKEDALLWFGRLPPDLSLSTRARGIDWVYNYLLGFYPDITRPFGVNNHLIKNTAMPDPLTAFRDQAFPNKLESTVTKKQSCAEGEVFELEKVVADIVNFLAYSADPTQIERKLLGKKVCGFLLLFSYLVFLLKNKIWKNIK